ncbi:MAG: hypothetical protein JOY59_05060 [Candidatus Eremiobacteraeota bacterium]|nr:hypothetical protein [Candidatus Eremiobacteraeota bacterium]
MNGGVLVCTLQVNAPPGSDQFVVQTYDNTNLTLASIVSAATFAQTINAVGLNILNVVTNPVPFNINVAGLSSGIHVAASGATALPITFQDADGLSFTGAFDAPIMLSLSSPSSHYTLSKATWSGTADSASIVADSTTPSGSTTVTLTFTPGSSQQSNNGGFCPKPSGSCGATVSTTFNVTTP